MAEYEYAGPHPVSDGQGEIVHPGDRREFKAVPDWGPWELLGEPDMPPPADDPPAPPKAPRAVPVTPEGM